MNKERLLNVARALREGKPENFDMYGYVRGDCGTPACALGHYASRTDLQSFLKIANVDGFDLVYAETGSLCGGYESERVCDHFDITALEAEEIFHSHGCGGAQTNVEAAEYIERFVKEHGE